MDAEVEFRSSDDEETLAMKETLIKIRLKQKKLLAKGGTKSPGKPAVERPVTPPPRPLSSLQNPFASPKSAQSCLRSSRIQVPGSPSPQKRKLPVSPARIVLGIDKGLSGRDVSLRRTPEKPGKTFNQRLSETRNSRHEHDLKTRQTSLQRKTGFNPVPAFSDSSLHAEPEGISRLSIAQRKVSAEDCSRAAASCTDVFGIHQFYAAVAPPEYELAESVGDFIVFGIVASKSTARTTGNGSKYCVFQLSDLKTDITLFLYESAFERYWTLPMGTLCFFLNPQFQKPRAGAHKLSLKMTDDTGIMEIGRCTDFGICRSLKKAGSQCTAWINSKRQDVCDYHIDLTVSKAVNKRIEFASGTRLFDPRQPSKKQRKEAEEYAQHALFFGDQVTTLKGSAMDEEGYELPIKDTSRLQKEAEARQREREVLAKLMANSATSAGHEYFETKDPNASVDDGGADAADKDRVFSATMLRKLGFDPTKRVKQTYQSGARLDESSTERDAMIQKDGSTVNLTVEHGRGSSLYSNNEITFDAERKTDAESDSDLEIVH